MKKCFYVLIILTISVILSSCSLDDGSNFHFKPLRIVSAELPESFELEQTYQITVTYELPDSCTTIFDFDITKSDTTARNVVVFGTVRTDQEACATVVSESQASFNFICLYEEDYTFRFWNGEGEDAEQAYFEVIVPVN